ncbi:MAG: hypothetical protein H7061_13265 [Bdellovibrionaceae bacterium]|nr:hypothetical protein [Bdellovibrio sp.]
MRLISRSTIFSTLLISTFLFFGSTQALACGEKDKCPASSCNVSRCEDYIGRKGEYAGRPVLRCIDLCYSACKDLVEGTLEQCGAKPAKKVKATKSRIDEVSDGESDSSSNEE